MGARLFFGTATCHDRDGDGDDDDDDDDDHAYHHLFCFDNE